MIVMRIVIMIVKMIVMTDEDSEDDYLEREEHPGSNNLLETCLCRVPVVKPIW